MKFRCHCSSVRVKLSNDPNLDNGDHMKDGSESWKHCFTLQNFNRSDKELSKRAKWLKKHAKGKYVLAGCHAYPWKLAFTDGNDALKYNLVFKDIEELSVDYSKISKPKGTRKKKVEKEQIST